MPTFANLMQTGGRVPLQQFLASRSGGGASPLGGAPGEPPQYADVFNYLNPDMEGAHAPGGWAAPTQGDIIGYHTEQRGGGEGGTVDVQVPDYAQGYTIDQSKLPDKYKGLVARYNAASGGSPGITQYDFSKLPGGGATVFGDDPNSTINQMASLGTGANPTMYMKSQGGRQADDQYVKDKSQVKYDPRFGWITPQQNLVHPEEKADWLDNVGKIGMMAGMAAMGMPALGGSAMLGLAASGMGALHSGGETGDWKKALIGAAPGLIGAGLGGTFGDLGGIGNITSSIPPELLRALQLAKTGYGAYNASRRGNIGGEIGSGISLAQLLQHYGG